jgi:hypothetical protein
MASYRRRTDLEAHDHRLAEHDAGRSEWAKGMARAQQMYQQKRADVARDRGRQPPGAPPLPEPEPPEQLPEPPPPDPPPTFAARVVEEVTEIETPYGPAMVMPGHVIVTEPDGSEYAMPPDEFARHFVEEQPQVNPLDEGDEE